MLNRYLIFGVFIPAIAVALDQASKYWATRLFKAPFNFCAIDPHTELNMEFSGVLDWALLCNRGVSWGMLQGDSSLKRWGLTLLAFVMCGVLLYMLRTAEDKLSRLSLGLIIGGAIGNGIDRALFGAVTDFIDFSDIGFKWVFNIADSFITMGVIGLLLASFILSRAEKAAEKANAES